MAAIPHRLFQQEWPDGGYRLFQLGFVVDDLLGTAARWATVFGVGPFHVLTRRAVPCNYRGTPSVLDAQVAVAQAGPVQIELIEQHGDGPSVYLDLVASGRSRFHQLCSITPDYERTLAHYLGLGYELATEMEVRGQRIAYVDTVDDFGFHTEVVEHTPQFLAGLEAIAQTCAGWDGADPVRLLTRDGYRTP